MKTYYPDASLTLSLIADIESRDRQYEENRQLQEMIASAEEKSLTEIAVPDLKGDTINLSTLQGKVILMVFWSSADSRSIQSLLALQSTYNKYQNSGFEIYAISLDNLKSPWETSVRFNEFDWINVSELSYPNSMVDKYYNVTKLPTSFLINKDGSLVAKDIYGRNLEIWLDNLL
jgi:peroxiredoxin